MYAVNRKPYKNGLVPVPHNQPLSVYQLLAHSGKLWFYDDHLAVTCVHPHPFREGGTMALVANRDTRAVTAESFAYLGRGFLTTPKMAERISNGTLLPSLSIRGLHDAGFVVPSFKAPENTPVSVQRDFEHWMNTFGPDLLREFASRPPQDLKS